MQVGDSVHVDYIPPDDATYGRRGTGLRPVVQRRNIYKLINCVRCSVLEIQPDRCKVLPSYRYGTEYETSLYEAWLRPSQELVLTATWVPIEHLSSEFEVDDSVTLHSLVSKPEYNGKSGVLVGRDVASRRWHFRTAMGFELSVKEDNLLSRFHVGLSVFVHRLANGDAIARNEGFIAKRLNNGKYDVVLVVFNAAGERREGHVVVRREGMVRWHPMYSQMWIDNPDHPFHGLHVENLAYRYPARNWLVSAVEETPGVPIRFLVQTRELQTPLEKVQNKAMGIQQSLRRHLPSEHDMQLMFHAALEENGHKFEDIRQLCIPSWQDDEFTNLAGDLQICNTCGTLIEKDVAHEQCEGCTLYCYCSVECKTAHWEDTHKFECRDVRQNLPPVPPDAGGVGPRPTKTECIKVSTIANAMFMIMSTSSNFDNLEPYSGRKDDSSYINKYLRALKQYNKDVLWTFVPYFSLYTVHFMPIPLAVFAKFYQTTTRHTEVEKFQVLAKLCRESVYIPTIIIQKPDDFASNMPGVSFNMLDLLECDTVVYFKGRL